jgi:hypothetical protein
MPALRPHERRVYQLYGVAFASNVPIAGAPETAGEPAADLRLAPPAELAAPGRPPDLVSLPGEPGPPSRLYRRAGALLLDYPTLGAVRVTLDGGELAFAAQPGAEAAMLELTLALPLAYLLFRRGALPLHASAVAFGRSVVGLVAAGGMGKTTLALACAVAGARLAGDDLLALRTRAGAVLAAPGPGSVLLRPDSAAALGLTALAAAPGARPGWKPRVVVAKPLRRAVRCSAIALLDRGAQLGAPGKVPPAEAAAHLAGQVFGFALFTAAEKATALGRLAQVVAAVPVIRLPVPDDLGRLPEAVRRVRALATPQAAL